MAIEIASNILIAIGVYLALGVLFAIAFLAVGVRKIDPDAREGTLGFRFLIFPGTVALWPILMMRWRSGRTEPPEERGAHRDGAGGA